MTGIKNTELRPKLRKKLSIGKKILLVILALIATIVFAYSRYLHPTGEIVSGLYAIRAGGNGSPMVNFFILEIDDKCMRCIRE